MDEALRRAAADNASTNPLPSIQKGNVFVSPWTGTAPREADEPQERPSAASRLQQTEGLFRGWATDWRDRLVLPGNKNHMLVEQFRRLAGALHHAQTAGSLRSLMVTSASPADGKTFTAVNLALILSGSYGRRVLLVDADLRKPSIDKVCGIRAAVGLSDALRAPREQKLSVVNLGDGLTFLPVGRPDPDPMSVLTSPRLKAILDEATEQFDWVILDAPPAAPLADAGLIGALVDTVLMVVRARQTHHAAVLKAMEAIERDKIFGVVLNSADSSTFAYGAYGYAEPVDVSTPFLGGDERLTAFEQKSS